MLRSYHHHDSHERRRRRSFVGTHSSEEPSRTEQSSVNREWGREEQRERRIEQIIISKNVVYGMKTFGRFTLLPSIHIGNITFDSFCCSLVHVPLGSLVLLMTMMCLGLCLCLLSILFVTVYILFCTIQNFVLPDIFNGWVLWLLSNCICWKSYWMKSKTLAHRDCPWTWITSSGKCTGDLELAQWIRVLSTAI